MNEFEERLLALLETAEQQAEENKEQSDENEKLLKTVRELVAHVEEAQPVLDRAVKTAKNFYSSENLKTLENICGTAVHHATSRNIDHALIGQIEHEIASKFENAEFNELSEQVKVKMSLVTEDMENAGTLAKQASAKLNEDLKKIGWRIGVIAIPITIICAVMLLLVHLVVKANDDDVRALQAEIQQLEHVKAQSNGDDALQVLLNDNQLGRPVDLLGSDIEMPGLDGYELAFDVRDNSVLKQPYIILHTSLNSEMSLSYANQVGANEALTKFDADELLHAMLRRFAER